MTMLIIFPQCGKLSVDNFLKYKQISYLKLCRMCKQQKINQKSLLRWKYHATNRLSTIEMTIIK